MGSCFGMQHLFCLLSYTIVFSHWYSEQCVVMHAGSVALPAAGELLWGGVHPGGV